MATRVAKSRPQGSGVKPSKVTTERHGTLVQRSKEPLRSSRRLQARQQSADDPKPSRSSAGSNMPRAKPVRRTKARVPTLQEQTESDQAEFHPSPVKRRRTSLGQSALEDAAGQEVASGDVEDCTDPISLWAATGRWPGQYFEESLSMERMLARKKSSRSLSRSLSRKRSEPGSSLSTTPSDQKPREEKSAPYRDPRYELVLKTKGVFLGKFKLGISQESKKLCEALLEKEQPIPSDSLFQDDLFETTCEMIQGRNEAKVIQDITRLIVPSAESLATRGVKHHKHVIESVNEGWNNAIPVTGTRPQPDYSVGFKREAFTDDQLEKLSPFVGDFITGDLSFFMATYYMFFPFLACEVKCGAAALDIADRQNMHSMTVAARAVVELFRLVKRESELHCQILSFSVSHDHRSVRIYGYYPVISGKDTKYYRHPIRTFDFTELDGKERWTAYRFAKNVYDLWMPEHFKRICSAIDQLPSQLDFDVAPLPEETGLSQELASHGLSESDADPLSATKQSQPSLANQHVVTPESSFRGTGAAKRPRKRMDDGKQRVFKRSGIGGYLRQLTSLEVSIEEQAVL